MYKAKVTVCSESHTKHINANVISMQNFLNVKPGGRVQLKCDGTRWRTWRGNWRMEWVASTLHTTSEHGVSSITTADAQTSAASSRLNWRPCRFKWTRPFRAKDEIWFLRMCHHISNAVYVKQPVGHKRFVTISTATLLWKHNHRLYHRYCYWIRRPWYKFHPTT